MSLDAQKFKQGIQIVRQEYYSIIKNENSFHRSVQNHSNYSVKEMS